jgi:hypothetical protein
MLTVLLGSGCERKNESEGQATAPTVTQAAVTSSAGNVAPTPVATAPRAAAISDQVQGSCSIMALSCSDYQGDAASTVLKATCERYSGKWSDGPCPREKIQGICTKLEPPFRNITYTYPPGTAETARTACTNTPGGVFSTP